MSILTERVNPFAWHGCVGVEIANRGQIRFIRKGPKLINVTLTISYEVPDVLVPFANVREGGPGERAGLPLGQGHKGLSQIDVRSELVSADRSA